MNVPIPAAEVLNREYLELRAKLLQIASVLDRMDRAEGDAAGDPRMKQIHDGLRILLAADTDRAERIQLLFSLPYLKHWKEDFGFAQTG